MSETLDRPEVADEVVDARPASSAITQYNVTAQALAELRQRLAGKTYALQTVAGDKEARADRLELVRLRTSLEAKRKELKAPALERSRLIDAEAKRIESEILALEGPIDTAIKADERRREEERAARAAAEAARVEALRKRIEYLRGIAPRAAGKPAAEIAAKIAMVEGITIGPDFAELQAEAQDVHAELLGQLRDMHTATVAQEEAAARVKAESERLARVDRFGRKLMELRSLSVGMGSRSAAAIRVALDTLKALVNDPEGWAEFATQADEAREAVLAELQVMLAGAEDRERVAAEQAAEAQRLAVQRLEQERIAAEQRAAELKRQQEEEARAESDRLEKLADERRASLAALPSSVVILGYGPEVQQFATEAVQAIAATNTEGQSPQQVLKAEGESPDATDRDAPANASPRVGAMGVGQPADAGPVLDSGRAPSALAEGFAALAAEARATRFPSQPKMGTEWWARFYALVELRAAQTA